jgi:hypothetical protein
MQKKLTILTIDAAEQCISSISRLLIGLPLGLWAIDPGLLLLQLRARSLANSSAAGFDSRDRAIYERPLQARSRLNGSALVV